MELLVLGYLIYQMTSSAFQVGLIAVFLNLPRPFMSPFAGVLADRLDRRRIMVGALIGLSFHVLNQASGHLGIVFNTPAVVSAMGPTLAVFTIGIILNYRAL